MPLWQHAWVVKWHAGWLACRLRVVVSVKTHSSTNFPPGLVRRVILVGGYAIQHDLGWRRRLRRVVSIAQKVLLYRNICSWYQVYICFGFRLLNILCTLFIIIIIFSLCSPCLPQLAHTHTHTHTHTQQVSQNNPTHNRYALGQCAPLVAALWGLLVWKEFKVRGSTVRCQFYNRTHLLIMSIPSVCVCRYILWVC